LIYPNWQPQLVAALVEAGPDKLLESTKESRPSPSILRKFPDTLQGLQDESPERQRKFGEESAFRIESR
jgi:hypothetical protein